MQPNFIDLVKSTQKLDSEELAIAMCVRLQISTANVVYNDRIKDYLIDTVSLPGNGLLFLKDTIPVSTFNNIFLCKKLIVDKFHLHRV